MSITCSFDTESGFYVAVARDTLTRRLHVGLGLTSDAALAQMREAIGAAA